MKQKYRLGLTAASPPRSSFPDRCSAQQKVKIGFITTLSARRESSGEYMKNSVELALDHLGRRWPGSTSR